MPQNGALCITDQCKCIRLGFIVSSIWIYNSNFFFIAAPWGHGSRGHSGVAWFCGVINNTTVDYYYSITILKICGAIIARSRVLVPNFKPEPHSDCDSFHSIFIIFYMCNKLLYICACLVWGMADTEIIIISIVVALRRSINFIYIL